MLGLYVWGMAEDFEAMLDSGEHLNIATISPWLPNARFDRYCLYDREGFTRV
jgi:hypothetical protein